MTNNNYSKQLNDILDVKIHKRAKDLNNKSATCYDLVYCILEDKKSDLFFILSYMDVAIKDLISELFKEHDDVKVEEDITEEEDIDENAMSCVALTKRVSSLLRSAEKIANKNNDEETRCEHVLTAILKYRGDGEDILYMKNIFSKYGVNYDDFWCAFRLSMEDEEGLRNYENKPSRKTSRRKKYSPNNKMKGEPPITKEITSEDKIQKIILEFISSGQMLDVNSFVKDNYMEFVGREEEVNRCVRVLCRKQKCNLLIIGESGTGKTSLVHSLVQRINRDEVPEKIKGKKIFQIFMDNMVAGTKYRGQFEEKMKNLFKVISLYGKESGVKPVVFFDEIHTIIGAGSAEGSTDAAGMLKPKMSSEEIQCIGTTTINEFRKYLSKDPALMRRFSTIFLEEPNEEETYNILCGIKHLYEDHHKIHISDEVIRETVRISNKYIKDRFFPDKAIDIIDEACVKVVQEYGGEISKGVYLDLDKETVYDIVSESTHIPISLMDSDEMKKLKNLETNLKQAVLGQDEVVESISSAVVTGRSGFRDSEKPIGTFMFIGTTGTGKTLLAKELSRQLFGTDKIIRLDMSEYMEKHSVSRIVGSPPGYIGYDEGGQLCEQIKKKPYSVVLLDEIEKAHPDVINLFLQVFDEGRLTDSTGRFIDFRNTIIIMTSNLSASKVGKIKNLGFHSTINTMTEKRDVEKFLNDEVKKFFSPELVNRIDEILVFNKLGEDQVRAILCVEFENVRDRVKSKGLNLVLQSEAKDFLTERGFDPDFGARPMKRALKKYVEDPLAKMYVCGDLSDGNTVYISHNKENPECLSFSVK